jgi:hypothetical protein
MPYRPQGGLAAQLMSPLGGINEEDHIWVRLLIFAILGVHRLGEEF